MSDFAGYVRSRGYFLKRDENLGSTCVCREEEIDGEVYFNAVQFGDVGERDSERWQSYVDMAEEEWIRFLGKSGVVQR